MSETTNSNATKEELLSAGNALRHRLFNKITPILLGCDHIGDSQVRLMIQACCLDMVTSVEDLIKNYSLDSCGSKSKLTRIS